VTSLLCDLANAHLRAGSRDLALAVAEEALKRASAAELPLTAAEVFKTVGDLRSELKEFRLAEAAYQEAFATFQRVGNSYGQIGALLGLAWLYHLEARPELQIENARLAWEMATTMGEPDLIRSTLMQLAIALADGGFHLESIQHLEAILQESPRDAAATLTLGWVLFLAGQYERSIAQSLHAIELDPTHTEAVLNLGHAYLALGRPDEAERQYRRAIHDRRGGENFTRTVAEIKDLLAHKPAVPRGLEMLQLVEEAQRQLEGGALALTGAGESSGVAPG
jgi:tetratricopeptide (TPR) repeat protein